jgi:hypothetical protein
LTDLFRVRKELLSGRRKSDAFLVPMKKGRAKLLFQQSNSLRYVRLHRMERVRRPGHPAFFCHRCENLKIPSIHYPVPPFEIDSYYSKTLRGGNDFTIH